MREGPSVFPSSLATPCPIEASVNLKKLVLVVPALFVSLVAASGCAGGSVDSTSCASVIIGDTRSDVSNKLGSSDKVSLAPNGYATVVFSSDTDSGKLCCTVTFNADGDTGIAVTRPAFSTGCN
jgi:hypothetical protein